MMVFDIVLSGVCMADSSDQIPGRLSLEALPSPGHHLSWGDKLYEITHVVHNPQHETKLYVRSVACLPNRGCF